MRDLWSWALAAIAVFAGQSQAQPWLNQVNISMCTWASLRTAQIHDRVYLDGGSLWYLRGFASGDTQPERENESNHFIYYLNLSSTFNTQSDNLTTLFGSFEKGDSVANNLAPTYEDGALLANDNKFFLYGGLIDPTESEDPPPADTILAYEAYQYGPYDSSDWEPHFLSDTLEDGVTRYITHGAGVSAPSEDLAFYISGMRAPGWGPIDGILDGNTTATNLSRRMITVDMADMQIPVFSNVSIPDSVPPRANAEAVWLPVAERGIIVLVGGVTAPESIYRGLPDDLEVSSQRESPAFMEIVSVYDVADNTWYNQNTTGDIPPMLTSFCSVYASAQDRSSHNIYIYGGYDGLSQANDSSDDVYVLTVPSFEWIKLYDGDGEQYGRRQHKCVKPYPDQMLVLGGMKRVASDCIDMIRVFNLNTGRFQDSYNPDAWGEYEVPDLVAGRIGGDASGGATKTAPDSWATSSLADVFERSYTKTIQIYYPYEKTNSNTTTTSVPSGGGDGFPGWAGAVIGVVLGILLLAGLFAFWFLRRRKGKGSRRQSEVSRGSRVMQWVHAGGAFAPPGPKDPDNSTTVSGGFTNESTVAPSETPVVSRITAEAAGDPVYEMQGRNIFHAVELPTSYNEDSVPATSPSASFPGVIGSPISPEIPQEKEGDTPAIGATRPGHHRNVSSLSSIQSHSPNIGYESDNGGAAQRPHYVSGLSDTSISSAGRFTEGAGGGGVSGSSNRGLGLEDIPDTEGDHREGTGDHR
ncbi:uncharacterized protein BDV17DRAFT_283775 [Aspergillus undulatus]|uniref:uncharacterized protein n=1 Tax=Aspergillus undulatus TaxID=1810928 RepID=UPI003CCDF298